jgi:cobalt/nickel transport system permease protein
MYAIDRYAWTNRWYRHHPGERLLLAGGGLLLALALPPLTAGPLLCALMAGATVVGARVPARAFLGVMALPAGFLLTSAPFLALSLDLSDGVRLAYSPAGAAAALTVTLRSLGALSCLACLALTTPVAELVPWLRRVGVPAAVVEIALLIYRLIFIFMERALERARRLEVGLAARGYVGELRVLTPQRRLSPRRLAGIGGLLLAVALGSLLLERALA